MNVAPTMTTSSSILVDMYIGPVFDAERYLELERQLFKVEPRPIPGSDRSATESNPETTILDKFIDKATKFSWWLDDVLKAPFRAFSSKSSSSMNEGSKKTGNGMRGKDKGPEITPPPRVYKAKRMESRRYSGKQAPAHVGGNEVPKYGKKAAVPETCPKKVGVIRNGHVQALIKKYEELSDVSTESSCRMTNGTQTRSIISAVEPGRTEKKSSLPVARQGHVTEEWSVRRKTDLPKAVSKPAKVASASMMLMGRKTNLRADKSGVHVKLSQDDNLLDVGDTKICGSNGNEMRRNIENGRSTFCGMQRGGVMKSATSVKSGANSSLLRETRR